MTKQLVIQYIGYIIQVIQSNECYLERCHSGKCSSNDTKYNYKLNLYTIHSYN